MTDSLLDAAPAAGLERAFQLPDYVRESPELVELYNEMVSRLRQEADGLPMGTLQHLLIERIASFYVQIKFKENTNDFRLNQQKEFNTYWLQLTTEFNRLLQASDDSRRNALLVKVGDIVIEGLKLIENVENRKSVQQFFSGEFSSLNY